MYIPIVLLAFVGILIGSHFFLSWLLAEMPEDRDSEGQIVRPPRNFYNPRTWEAFRRLTAKRPALLMYRRDKNGRFRKLSQAAPPPVSRSVKRRNGRRPRRPAPRAKTQIPAE